MKKGEMSTYFSTTRGCADEMTVAKKPLDDGDIVSYILNGLDAGYNSLIEQVNDMADLIGQRLCTHVFLTLRRVLRPRRCNETRRSSISSWQTLLHVGTTTAVRSRLMVIIKENEVEIIATMVEVVVLVIPTTPIKIISVIFVENLCASPYC
jgi:hypothetical protein